MINELRNLRIESIELDDAVSLQAYASILAEAYAAHGLIAPPWLQENSKALTKFIQDKRRDNLERAKKRIELKLEEMKTTEEKRSDYAAELARINKELGV